MSQHMSTCQTNQLTVFLTQFRTSVSLTLAGAAHYCIGQPQTFECTMELGLVQDYVDNLSISYFLRE